MHALTDTTIDRFGAIPGTVHLVGAGPGDPGLLTLRAAALLASADLVLHDQLVTPEVVAMCDLRAQVVPVGRRCGDVVLSHEQVVARMVAAARSGQRVVRLKGGDPMVFGRGGEEAMELLAVGVGVEAVPGISAAVAGPAAAGIPVTHRGISRGFLAVTAHTFDGSDGLDWDIVARFPGTVVVLMGRRRWHDLTARLVASGRRPDEPAAAIAWASTPRQQVVTATLATIATASEDDALGTPAILVLGDVVALRNQLAGAVSVPGSLTSAADAPGQRHDRAGQRHDAALSSRSRHSGLE